MNLTNLLTLIIGVITILTPLALLIRDPKLYRNKVLFLLAFVSGPFWALSIVLFYEATELSLNLFALNCIYTVSVLTSMITFEFTRVFPFRDKVTLVEKAFLLLPAVIFLYKIWLGNEFIQGINVINGEKTPILGIYYIFWFIWFGAIITWRIYVLSKKLKSITEIGKKQTAYIIGGLAIAGLGILPTNMILPYLGNFKYIWVGPFMGAIMVSVIAYAVSTLRFFNLKKFFQKFLMFFISFALPSLIIGSILYIVFFVAGIPQISKFIVLLGMPILSYFLIESIKQLLESEKLSLKEEISKETESELDLDIICQKIERICIQNLNLTEVSFFFADIERKTKFRYAKENEKLNLKIPFLEVISFGSYYEDKDKIIMLQELKHLQLTSMEEQNIWRYKRFLSLIDFLEKNRINVIVPISLRNNDLAIICLGQKKDNDLFEKEEIESIQEFKVPVKILFERALLYQEVQKFNQTLRQKVNEQTQELQVKVQQLQEARRKERDMIDIMGHELRTPATVVKLNIELLEKYIDSNPEEFKRYVKRIKGAIENEIKLINTLLSSAKLEGNKIEINNESVNIKEEIDMSLHGHELEAEEKGVQLINKTDPNTPNIYSDKARTVEILNNLVDNAIKYTEEGSVTVETVYDESFVKVSVVDTGKGIAKEEIPKLGQKFHRIDNYLESNESLDIVRPGGTGLGLYVTFKLVELMGGKIWVESELGVGSKFIFTLPIYKGQTNGKVDSSSNDMFERLGLKTAS